MAERIQNILAGSIAQARQAGEGERLQGLEGLAKQFAAAEALGWITPEPVETDIIKKPAPTKPGKSLIERSQSSSPNILTHFVTEFNRGERQGMTPEFVTSAFQTIWQVRTEGTGLEVTVSPCDRSAEELAELVKAGRRIGYLPEQVRGQQDRPLLARMFPNLGSYSVREGNPVTNEVDRAGWFDYEASIDAPYLNTTEQRLRDAIAAEGKRLKRNLVGMNLNEYIVAGEDSKLFSDKYLDEYGTGKSTFSRLLGSRGGGGVVGAGFFSDGSLSVGRDLGPRGRDPYLGGRSVGVKKA